MGAALASVPGDWLAPLAAFPGTRSPMIAPEAWSMTFRDANARVAATRARAGLPEPHRITPHMLRHTFATEWLSAELKRIACDDADFARAIQGADAAQLRRRHFNPLLRIKSILGHRSLNTTLLYINYMCREELYINYMCREDETRQMPADSWIESFIEDVQ
jgi:integrase